jgi:hypothetical protein
MVRWDAFGRSPQGACFRRRGAAEGSKKAPARRVSLDKKRGVESQADASDAEQGGDANGRFGSLGLLQGQRQKVIRHECGLPAGLRRRGDRRAGDVGQIDEAPGGG